MLKFGSKSKYDFLVVGLGNPGTKYRNTRHNIGFMTLDYIASKENIEFKKSKFRGETSEKKIGDKNILFLKPDTFMNLSGESVLSASKFYKIPPENIIIIYDDISLGVGKLRIRKKGSAGGHNGIKNIIANLNSDNFPRIKIGVGEKPAEFSDLADYVLSPFKITEREILDGAIEKAYMALKVIFSENTDKAMNLYNG
ncbi:MAG: aminoacyl-tRNA hydrolase [Clostridia bacterium]|nr:aminoacyl-tRNA hydrolase [Clostridia bacterium]